MVSPVQYPPTVPAPRTGGVAGSMVLVPAVAALGVRVGGRAAQQQKSSSGSIVEY